MTLMRSLRRLSGRAVERTFLVLFDGSWMVGPDFSGNIGGTRVMMQAIWRQKILGFNRHAPVPMSASSIVSSFENLAIPADRGLRNLQSPGCYFQNFAATITWGRGVFIAPNVGIITANHDVEDLDAHADASPVTIGDECWIGMGAILLPGVTLGDRTIVGAGSVVTRSFPEGHQVIAGNPARVVRRLAGAPESAQPA